MANQSSKCTRESVLAVVGGGRWARVIVSVLAEMSLPFDRVVVVSRFNSQIIDRFIGAQAQTACLPFTLVSSVNELLLRYDVRAAVVVNSAGQHFSTSSYLLDHGVNVLVEKPVVLSTDQTHTLLNKAEDSGVCLVPGLQYRFCTYLHYFAEQILRFGKTPSSFSIEWSDENGETRYNEMKTYDSSINVAQDVMPHIWAILSTIFPHNHSRVDCCQNAYEGRYADFSVLIDNVRGRVTLERDAAKRRRLIQVYFDPDESLSIDFTQEPGIISLNGKIIPGDPNWDKNLRPIARQLHYFFSVIGKGISPESERWACIESVSFSERASSLLKISEQYLCS